VRTRMPGGVAGAAAKSRPPYADCAERQSRIASRPKQEAKSGVEMCKVVF